MIHEEVVGTWIKPDALGVEIGAFDTPIPDLQPFYVDRYAEFAGRPCKADYWGDACRLPFRSNTLDYVASSHVLEHVANPVATLLEWHRVLADKGIIYMVLPDRPFTFDHARELTAPEHMWMDFENKVNQFDGTHIYEFVDEVNWPMFRPEIPADEIERDWDAFRAQYVFDLEHKKEFNMHFHVFEQQNLEALVKLVAARNQLPWTILDCKSGFPVDCPNGILMVI